MPRQRVNPAPTGEPYHLEVGWSAAGGTVQVGVADAPMVIKGEIYDSVWAHLDRKGCNDLIRLVRRARDSAFGADQ